MNTDFKIKNRTSTVSPERTSARIDNYWPMPDRQLLADAGASDIRKRYEAGELVGIDFVIPTEYGIIAFRLPVNVQAADKVLHENRKRRRGFLTAKQRQAIAEQSKRTAWKMAQEWLEIQLSMVAMKQAELVQVLLPYSVNRNDQTLFETMKQSGYTALLDAPDPDAENIIDALENDLNQ